MRCRIWLFISIMLVLLSGCFSHHRSQILPLSIPQLSNTTVSSGDVFIEAVNDRRTFLVKTTASSIPTIRGNLETTPKEKLARIIGRLGKNGRTFGMLLLPEGQSVETEIYDLLKVGLESRGFTISADPQSATKLAVDVKQFWSWANDGSVSVHFEAILDTKITISTQKGTFEYNVSGSGINSGQMMNRENHKRAYDLAFTDFLNDLDGVDF